MISGVAISKSRSAISSSAPSSYSISSNASSSSAIVLNSTLYVLRLDNGLKTGPGSLCSASMGIDDWPFAGALQCLELFQILSIQSCSFSRFLMEKTTHHVIVHHADGLHVGITNR